MTTPSSLDLHTLNAVEMAVVQALRDQVCQWEQDALDSSREGHHAVADAYTKWALAAELCAYKVGTVVGTLFSDGLRSFTQSLVEDERVVQLPDLSQTTTATLVTAD